VLEKAIALADRLAAWLHAWDKVTLANAFRAIERRTFGFVAEFKAAHACQALTRRFQFSTSNSRL
jgi:hypothetical protein